MLDRIVYTDHGEEKRREEGLSTDDVRAVLERGLVLRRYPEDRPFPSRLCWGGSTVPPGWGPTEKGARYTW